MADHRRRDRDRTALGGARAKPTKLGEVVRGVLDSSGLAERVEKAAVVPEWSALVGAQIAAVTEPIRLTRDGTLFVAVRTNAWMQELSLMEREILGALNGGRERPRVLRLHWRLMR